MQPRTISRSQQSPCHASPCVTRVHVRTYIPRAITVDAPTLSMSKDQLFSLNDVKSLLRHCMQRLGCLA